MAAPILDSNIRQIRNIQVSRADRPIFRLERGNFVMMLTAMDRFYVGEVLDIYKQAASSRYGSVDDATSASSLSYLALRVYLLLQVQTVSYFIYSSLGLFLIVYRPPLPSLMMTWKKMCPHSPGITMATSCTLMHLGSFAERVEH